MNVIEGNCPQQLWICKRSGELTVAVPVYAATWGHINGNLFTGHMNAGHLVSTEEKQMAFEVDENWKQGLEPLGYL